ncbi:MAG TPA: alpha/beta hydrolase [Methylophilus sp.]
MNISPVNHYRRMLCSGLLTSLLAACSPVSMLNAVIPTRQMRITQAVPFGPLPRQTLDIYTPLPVLSGAMPVVIFLYGGSWDSGRKEDYLFVAEALSSQGYLVVIPDYRVYPEVKFPSLMEDPAAAFAWVKANIAHYNGDPETIFLMGHSAGAHLAAMLALNPIYLQSHGLDRHAMRGMVGLAGPYDFLPLKSARLKEIFAPAEAEWRSQPIRFVDGHQPPMLLMVGMQDLVVWPRNSLRLASAIEQKGGEVTLKQYPAAGHVDMVSRLARPLRGASPLLADLVTWMQQHVH